MSLWERIFGKKDPNRFVRKKLLEKASQSNLDDKLKGWLEKAILEKEFFVQKRRKGIVSDWPNSFLDYEELRKEEEIEVPFFGHLLNIVSNVRNNSEKQSNFDEEMLKEIIGQYLEFPRFKETFFQDVIDRTGPETLKLNDQNLIVELYLTTAYLSHTNKWSYYSFNNFVGTYVQLRKDIEGFLDTKPNIDQIKILFDQWSKCLGEQFSIEPNPDLHYYKVEDVSFKKDLVNLIQMIIKLDSLTEKGYKIIKNKGFSNESFNEIVIQEILAEYANKLLPEDQWWPDSQKVVARPGQDNEIFIDNELFLDLDDEDLKVEKKIEYQPTKKEKEDTFKYLEKGLEELKSYDNFYWFYGFLMNYNIVDMVKKRPAQNIVAIFKIFELITSKIKGTFDTKEKLIFLESIKQIYQYSGLLDVFMGYGKVIKPEVPGAKKINAIQRIVENAYSVMEMYNQSLEIMQDSKNHCNEVNYLINCFIFDLTRDGQQKNFMMKKCIKTDSFSSIKEIFKIIQGCPKGYQIISKLGQGGFGKVYQVKRTLKTRTGEQDEILALKIEGEGDLANSHAEEILKTAGGLEAIAGDEELILNSLSKDLAGYLPIPRYRGNVDIELDGKKMKGILMEYIKGQDLSKLLEQTQNGLPLDQLLDLALKCTEAVAFLHSRGYRHGDIKPPNFIVRDDGKVKVTDFGVSSRLNIPYQTHGSRYYTSPEEHRKEENTSRSDVWSLGIMFYELATGQLPFHVEEKRDMLNFFEENKDNLDNTIDYSNMPKPLAGIIQKCLKYNPDERYQDALELKNDLNSYLLLTQKENGAEKLFLEAKQLTDKVMIIDDAIVQGTTILQTLSEIEKERYIPIINQHLPELKKRLEECLVKYNRLTERLKEKGFNVDLDLNKE